MLTEPVQCKSCNAVSVNGGEIHCQSCLKDAIRLGFIHALEQYGVWKDGQQFIGCMDQPITDVIRRFDQEQTADQIYRLYEPEKK